MSESDEEIVRKLLRTGLTCEPYWPKISLEKERASVAAVYVSRVIKNLRAPTKPAKR